MSEKRESVKRQTHLKLAFIFLGFWLFLAYIIISNIEELGGLSGLIDVIRGGDYSDLILLAFNIFLLAKFVQSMFKYFTFKDDTSKF